MATSPPADPVGVHLERTEDLSPRIDALAEALGPRVGVEHLLGDLKYRAHDSRIGRLAGRAVHRAIAWNSYDQRDPTWWPQGITTSADATAEGRIAGRRVLVTTWYAKAVNGIKRGSRLTFLDLDTLEYRHVLLVDPTLDDEGRVGMNSVRIHAGGIVWTGPWLHIAATARGFVTCHVDDIMRVPDDNEFPDEIGLLGSPDAPRPASFGHHYVLPVRFTHRAHTDDGHTPLRHSFLSLDRSGDPPGLLAGEYGRGGQSTRLARYELDAQGWLPALDGSGISRPVLDDVELVRMQGDVRARGRHHITVSQGPWWPGSVYTGQPGDLRRHRFALPMGPEDITYWPETDELWSVSEHPRRRWIFSMRRAWFD
ncbi:hypothetical protein [Nocardioides gilvus]|uniref:hypothetical protein n=1 Tax=Nocardioides gilvus TaxID=1735589 RepID=UPI0013A55B19|nr:hypothetical protein [Nocardioides gilvus]